MSSTDWLLLAIAIGVWAMALESIIWAFLRLIRWIHESRRAVALARRIQAAQEEAPDG